VDGISRRDFHILVEYVSFWKKHVGSQQGKVPLWDLILESCKYDPSPLKTNGSLSKIHANMVKADRKAIDSLHIPLTFERT